MQKEVVFINPSWYLYEALQILCVKQNGSEEIEPIPVSSNPKLLGMKISEPSG